MSAVWGKACAGIILRIKLKPCTLGKPLRQKPAQGQIFQSTYPAQLLLRIFPKDILLYMCKVTLYCKLQQKTENDSRGSHQSRLLHKSQPIIQQISLHFKKHPLESECPLGIDS